MEAGGDDEYYAEDNGSGERGGIAVERKIGIFVVWIELDGHNCGDIVDESCD